MSRSMSRNALDPSPKVILPATSTTLTSPTCLVLSFTLTEYASSLATEPVPYRLLLRHQMLYQSYLGAPWFQTAHPKVVHESLDQEDAASGMPQQVLLRQRIRQIVVIEAVALVRDPDHKLGVRFGYRQMHLLVGVVPVSMNHRVDHGFPHGHGDLVQVVFGDAGLLGLLQRQFFGVIDAFQGRIQKPFEGFHIGARIFSHSQDATAHGQNEGLE